MTLPKNYKSRSKSSKGKFKNWSSFTQGLVGTGIMIGIWAVTFGILASGIIKL